MLKDLSIALSTENRSKDLTGLKTAQFLFTVMKYTLTYFELVTRSVKVNNKNVSFCCQTEERICIFELLVLKYRSKLPGEALPLHET